MEKIYSWIQSFLPDGFSLSKYFQFVLILAVGMLVISILGRVIFGKRSALNYAVSSAVAILFMYVVNVVVYSLGLNWAALLSPLPFVTIEGDYLMLFNVLGGSFSGICANVLDMVIPVLEALPEWTETALHDTLINMAAEKGLKNGTLLWPVRIAMAGKTVTPGGAIEIAVLLGREEALRRLELGLSKLS